MCAERKNRKDGAFFEGTRTDTGFQSASQDVKELRRTIHSILSQMNYDYGRMQFNTVASGAMKMFNALESTLNALMSFEPHVAVKRSSGDEPSGYLRRAAFIEGLGILLRVLYPVTPHICDYLWRQLGYGDDILKASWPEPDEGALVQDEIELVLQINGKLRGNVRVAADADRAAIEATALAHEAAQKHIAGKPVKKVVVVPGRLVNVVTG